MDIGWHEVSDQALAPFLLIWLQREDEMGPSVKALKSEMDVEGNSLNVAGGPTNAARDWSSSHPV